MYNDIFTFPVTELRHQFEKVKCRKLTSDEKKLFKGYALEFFDNHVNGNQKPSSHVEGMKKFSMTFIVQINDL